MHIKNVYKIKTIIAGALGTVLFVSAPLTCFAAAPKVTVDEAVYINLDHYGAVEEVNIVKTCAMNGNKTYTDYGDYTEVINLTNGAAPVSDGKKIAWDLGGYDCDTFYFEGRSKTLAGELPWTIDVSYLLNGKPASAEDLAGASGVVSTIIDAVPNKKAPEYYRNNMVLTLGMLVDMESDNYSLEAPGSQLQSIGTKKAVMFIALPGETGNFRVDIGSKSYENLGVFMMMMPATMSSLDRISDYREVKDKVRGSLNAMSDSADVIFDSLQGMRSSLEEARNGMRKAKEAKGIYDEGKDALKSDADAAIDSLDAIESSLQNLNDKISVSRGDYAKTSDELETIRKSVYSTDKYIKDLEGASYDLEDSLKGLRHAMKDVDDEVAALKEIEKKLKGAIEAKGDAAGISTGEFAVVGIISRLSSLLQDLSEESRYVLGDTEGVVHEAGNLSAKASEVLNETNSLGGRMNNEYKEHVLELIDEMSAFINTSRISVAASKQALRSTRAMADAMEASLSSAIDSSLSGMIGILEGTMGIADGSEVFRNAKDVMKNAVDDELDELEEDSNILNIDTSLDFPSFTSDKNATPSSIQIILRTDEISIVDDEDTVEDIEPAPAPISLSGKIMAVIEKILPFKF